MFVLFQMFDVSLVCTVCVRLGTDGALVDLVPVFLGVMGALLNLARKTLLTDGAEKQKAVLKRGKLVSETREKKR